MDTHRAAATDKPSFLDQLRHLKPSEVEKRLAELYAEEKALRTLLRALKAAEREREANRAS